MVYHRVSIEVWGRFPSGFRQKADHGGGEEMHESGD